jgi:RNA polymerase sigma factor (sigma-70 family)
MNDYYATLRIQQGRLKAAIIHSGIKTATELGIRAGVSQGSVGDLLNFRKSPRNNKTGEWRPYVLKICKVLQYHPSELFPEHLEHEIPTNAISAFVEHAQLSGKTVLQLGPDRECERAETSRVLDEVMGSLSERERHVLKSRFWGDKTFDEIGCESRVTGETIRHIEARALRKLRHPSRLEILEQVYDKEGL